MCANCFSVPGGEKLASYDAKKLDLKNNASKMAQKFQENSAWCKITTRWWSNGDFVECSQMFGEDEPNVTDIFQMGWFNHQLDHNSPKKYTNLANKDGGNSSDVPFFSFFLELKVPRKELILQCSNFFGGES